MRILLLLIACNQTSELQDMASCALTGICNPAGCPQQVVPSGGSCSQAGLMCGYPFREDICIDGKWLACGDAVGVGCQAMQNGAPPPAEGSVCCLGDYTTPKMNSCDCIKGIQCSCHDYHVHCQACDL
jgi:hypothetical protein